MFGKPLFAHTFYTIARGPPLAQESEHLPGNRSRQKRNPKTTECKRVHDRLPARLARNRDYTTLASADDRDSLRAQAARVSKSSAP
jgi:hypothetical protein